MSKDPSPTPVSPPFLEEAKALARAHQKPGQTKEQTRLIAQGIAKGIEQYKRQQSAKARERDKSRKRVEKLRQANDEPPRAFDPSAPDHETTTRANHGPLLLGGGVFGLLSMALALLLLKGWSLTIAGWLVPYWLAGGWMLALAGLAAWLVTHALRNP